MDILNTLLQFVNLQAALVGVVAVQTYKYLIPGPIEGERSFASIPGKIWDRLMPFVGPTAATIACLALEWKTPHPEYDNAVGIVPQDVVRGLLSGLCSEFLLRIYYKTIAGM